jgi:D-galacturonate reductase
VTERPLNVLVAGAGMYVSGLGTSGFGTILPSLFQASRHGLVGSATIAATNPANRDAVLAKVQSLASYLGASIPVRYLPDGAEHDADAYLRAADGERFDCAIVSVPDHLHYAVTRELIERNLHVLVVKPLVPTLAENDELTRIAEQRGVYAAVEFHKRFDESNLRIKRMMREGAIGDVLYTLVEFSQRRDIPLERFREWAARTNIFQYLGVHYADLIHFCTGATPLRVSTTAQKGLLLSHGIDTWDAVQATIEWRAANGPFVSTILTNWIDPLTTTAMSDQKIKWIGTRGRIEADQKRRGLELVGPDGIQDINPYFSDFLHDSDDQLQFGGYGHRSIAQFLTDVAGIVAGRTDAAALGGARPTFRSARVSTAVVEAANRSLALAGEWVTVPS